MHINCWEFNNCGREIGGINAKKLGVCNSVKFTAFNETNHGFNGGRYCWHIAGTEKDSPKTCVHLPELKDCRQCDFYDVVKEEENRGFTD